MRRFNFEKYYEQLKNMPEPMMVNELPKVRLNLKGVQEYTKEKGVSAASLSEDEKSLFIET